MLTDLALAFNSTALPSAADLGLIVFAAPVGSLLSAVTGSGAGVVLPIVLLPIVGVRTIVPILSIAMAVSHIGRRRCVEA